MDGAMNYRRLQLTAYNESPQEENSFHVEVVIDPYEDWTDKSLIEKIIKPMFHCVYTRMIPEMPSLGDDGKGNPTEVGMRRLFEWQSKYFA